MFGHDALSNRISFNLLNAEFRTFRAGTEAAWDYEGDVYTITESATPLVATMTDPQGNAVDWDSTDGTLANSVSNAIGDLAPENYYRIAGFTDATITNTSITDPNQKDCSAENREAGAKSGDCGDCLSGFTADATGLCVADVADETETNWLLYGGVAIALILSMGMMK
tara:strand:- start:799 stop:1302 length:504 start_codon:yes stop_codon:yes gene_type:complete